MVAFQGGEKTTQLHGHDWSLFGEEHHAAPASPPEPGAGRGTSPVRRALSVMEKRCHSDVQTSNAGGRRQCSCRAPVAPDLHRPRGGLRRRVAQENAQSWHEPLTKLDKCPGYVASSQEHMQKIRT